MHWDTECCLCLGCLPSPDEDAVDIDVELTVTPAESDYVSVVLAVYVVGQVVMLVEVGL